MPELSIQQAEALIEANSILCPPIKSGYLGDLPQSVVLYIETAHHLQANQMIAKNLEIIQKIYAIHDQTFLYLPQLLQDGADVFRYVYPGLPIDQSVTPENITATVTAKLLAELNISPEIQGPMLLTYSNKYGNNSSNWVITHIKGKISVQQFFQTPATVYEHYNYNNVKYSRVLGDYSPGNNSTDPEERFDAEVNRIVSEIDERIRFLKEKGLFRILSDTIAPMLTPKLSRLCVTEDFRIHLPDYDDMEIILNPLSKAVYFLFLRHPEGIFLKNLPRYRDELTQIYRLLSNRENLQHMDESIRKLTDPSDNSIYEKCSRIKRAFIEKFSAELAQHYYVDGHLKRPKHISLPTGMISLPDALKNIKTLITQEDYMVMNLAEILKNIGIGEK